MSKYGNHPVDHISGLADVPGRPVLVNAAEWQQPSGAPKRLLAGLQPECFEFQPDRSMDFGARYSLTQAGDLFVVPAPGHTPHHRAVVLRRGDMNFLFTGEAVYKQAQLQRNELAGSHMRADLALRTMQTLQVYLR